MPLRAPFMRKMRSLFVFTMLLLCFSHAYGQTDDAITIPPTVDSAKIKHVDSLPASMPQGLATSVTLQQIIIIGNDVTRSPVIIREMSTREGDVIQSADIPSLIRENRLRLMNLAIFNDVDIIFQKLSPTVVDEIVQVKERWYIMPAITLQLADRNFNVWFVEQHHNINRINLGLAAVDKNFRGDLETLSGSVQLGYTQKLSLSYLKPYIDKDQKSGLGFGLDMTRSQQTYYATDSNKLQFIGNYGGPTIIRSFDASVSYVYRPGYYVRHTLQLMYNYYWVADTVIRANPDFFANHSQETKYIGLYYRFEYNGVDNWNYPLQGQKVVLTANALAGFTGLKFQSSAYLEAGLFRQVLPRWFVSLIVRGQVMVPGQEPYFFLNGLGTQVSYLRGYEYYMINGPDYGLLRFDLKRELIDRMFRNVPIKYLGAIPLRIYPKIFADVGGLYSPDPGNSFLSNRLLYSAGLGLDIVTAYDIKIRLEFAYNHMGENGLYLHTNSE